MVARAFRYAFRRLGARYPRAVLIAQAQFGHVVVVFGLGLLTLYTTVGDHDFLWLLLAAQLLLLVENVVALRLVFRLLDPVDRWLAGERGPEETVAAWRALVGLPLTFVRRMWFWPILLNALPWCAYAAARLGLSVWGGLMLFAGGLVVVLYGTILRYLAMELTMRPVLERVASELPDGADLGTAGIPLRWKLLAGLPLINIITGVVVSSSPSATCGTPPGGSARGTSARACPFSPPMRPAGSRAPSTTRSPASRSASVCTRRSARS